jgi:actin-like ATPase involved in cell morphogenesis
MRYALGVDLGTTYTAAAICRDGKAEIVTLGNRAASVPSVIFLRGDDEILTGNAASRRGLTEPGRVAREFKRRVGDPTPHILGGTPYSAEALMARLLHWTVEAVGEREGGPPEHVAVCHPANWGSYKQELLAQAIRLADLEGVTTLTEPEAAAIYYASQERVDPGSVIAVYDLGGGTFDAAVLRKHEGGWEVLGRPEGVERLGGVDFDEAVFNHVRNALREPFDKLDASDPNALAAVARLREECVEAKEALSSDTEVAIPVFLPTVQTEVRLTRGEFEAMIRPTLQDTIGALQRALRSAALSADDVTAVLLVGGSSRIPLVGQLVGAEFGRPVAVDAHPKHAVALGAAVSARQAAEARSDVAAPTLAAPAELADSPSPPPPSEPTPEPPTGGGVRRPRRRLPVGALAGGLSALVLVVLGAVLLGGGGDPETRVLAEGEVRESASESSTTTTAAATAASGPRADISGIRVQDGRYVLTYAANGFVPEIDDHESFHTHFFWDTVDPRNAGTNGPSPGQWLLWDTPATVNDPFFSVAARPAGADRICALVATHEHGVADVNGDAKPDTGTGNCVDLPAS